MENIRELINERLAQLPPNVVAGINSVDWQGITSNIADKHNLEPEDKDAFEIETTLVVLGIEPPNNYPNNLSKKVGISDEMVIEIAKEVDSQIISPILGSIESSVEAKEVIDEKEKQTPPPEHEAEIQIQKELHPVIEEGEVAHNVPTQNKEPVAPAPKINLSEIKPEKPEIAPTPKYTYPKGADPYREPVE